MTFTLYDDHYATNDGMRVLLNGLSLRAFIQNPVMLYMHNRGGNNPTGSEVIGKWENIRLVGKRLLADAVFDANDQLAQKIASKVTRGFLSGASIGILIKETSQQVTDKIQHQTGATITKSVLLEASIVDIPRCANALVNHCFLYSTYTMNPSTTTTSNPATNPVSATNTAPPTTNTPTNPKPSQSPSQQRIALAIEQNAITQEEGRYYQSLFFQRRPTR